VVEQRELEQRIAGLPWWHYKFEFDSGVPTPVFNQSTIDRHELRRPRQGRTSCWV